MCALVTGVQTCALPIWVGTWRFDPGSGHLEVTCTASAWHPPSTVEIGPAPRIGSFVVGLLATIFVPLFLGLAGVAVLLVTGILWSRSEARRVGKVGGRTCRTRWSPYA